MLRYSLKENLLSYHSPVLLWLNSYLLRICACLEIRTLSVKCDTVEGKLKYGKKNNMARTKTQYPGMILSEAMYVRETEEPPAITT